ncbi:MAG: hypothetical protein K6G90_03860 [Clostridia bacterium]|nr:hypothetical protein [Clostridia bacterium]
MRIFKGRKYLFAALSIILCIALGGCGKTVEKPENQASMIAMQTVETEAAYTNTALLPELKKLTNEARTIEDYIDAFETFHNIGSTDPDEISFFEVGNFDFGGKKLLVSFVRQYKANPDDDGYVQVHIDVSYEPVDEIDYEIIWSDEYDDISDFISAVRGSEAIKYITGNELVPVNVNIREENTD